MGWDVMNLMGETPFRGPNWKGWALKIETFLGPEMATSDSSAIWTTLAFLKIAWSSISLYCL